jgi:hypothetical protein
MPLADAALIHDTLREAAVQAESQADYLESDWYAETQRTARLAKPKEDRGEAWELSAHDKERIRDSRSKAARLFKLVES